MKIIIKEKYIILDHLKTIIFALSEGVIFNSKGRGYILKKLIKKISFILFTKSIKTSLLSDTIDEIIKSNLIFELIYEKKEYIKKEILKELDKQHKFLENCVKKLNNQKIFDTESIFFLYDTSGIPLELIEQTLLLKNIRFDREKFNIYLNKQKEKSLDNFKKKEIKAF